MLNNIFPLKQNNKYLLIDPGLSLKMGHVRANFKNSARCENISSGERGLNVVKKLKWKIFVILMLNTKVNGVGVEELILLDLFV